MMRFRFDEEDRKAVSLAQRNGKNMPIQGTSADILKRALRLLHEEMQRNFRQTRQYRPRRNHRRSRRKAKPNKIAEKLDKAMCAAGEEYIKKVPVKVDVTISDEWTK